MNLLILCNVFCYSENGTRPDPVIESGNTDHIRTLTDCGVDVGLTLPDGETWLHKAARTDNLQVLFTF